MKLQVVILALLAAGAIILSGPAVRYAATPAASGTAAGCVHWETEARWVGMAYNHLVHLDNACTKAMRCEVKTDVNPDPVAADLAPGEKKTVVTFLGSPASTFSATVTCQAKK